MVRRIQVNGHEIAYTTFGDSSFSRPIFYFHGFPGSHLEAKIAHEAASRLQATLIAPDRPGFGGSDTYPGRTLVDWPPVVAALADELKIETFSILAVSGGAPYGAACAFALKERIRRVLIVSGMAPIDDFSTCRGMRWPNRLSLWLAKNYPWLGKLTAQTLAGWWRTMPTAMLAWLYFLVSSDDRRILALPNVRQVMKRNFALGLSQGSSGVAQELLVLAQPWGFSLTDINVPVALWHGLDDYYVPVAMVKKLKSDIPHAELRLVAGRGHFMLIEMIEEAIQNVI